MQDGVDYEPRHEGPEQRLEVFDQLLPAFAGLLLLKALLFAVFFAVFSHLSSLTNTKIHIFPVVAFSPHVNLLTWISSSHVKIWILAVSSRLIYIIFHIRIQANSALV